MVLLEYWKKSMSVYKLYFVTQWMPDEENIYYKWHYYPVKMGFDKSTRKLNITFLHDITSYIQFDMESNSVKLVLTVQHMNYSDTPQRNPSPSPLGPTDLHQSTLRIYDWNINDVYVGIPGSSVTPVPFCYCSHTTRAAPINEEPPAQNGIFTRISEVSIVIHCANWHFQFCGDIFFMHSSCLIWRFCMHIDHRR